MEIATDAAKRAWDTNPDSVYGTLVAMLVLVVIALTLAVVMLWRSKEKQADDMMKIIKDATQGFTDINNALANIKESDLRGETSILEAIKQARENVLQHIESIKDQLRDQRS
jgi:F0F1-type ATP synthase membrane subunit b/b'